MPDVYLRAAQTHDAVAITALAVRAKAGWGYPGAWLDQWHAELVVSEAYIAAHQVWVAELKGAVVGSCALEDHQDHWTLEHVWVEPDLQGRGIGRLLVEHAIAIVQRTRPGPITVIADPFAVAFYEGLGARTVAFRAAPMPGAPGRRLPVMRFGPANAADSDEPPVLPVSTPN